jgi:uncharacterized membrane protein
VGEGVDREYLKRARWRVGLVSLLLMVVGLALVVAGVLVPVSGALAIIGCIGLNLVRVAH